MRPVGVSANTTFIVDIDKVNFNDLKCDNLGTWTTTGTKSTFFRFAASGIKISEKKPPQSGVYHVLTQRYYVHGTYYNLYHQIIVDIQGECNLNVYTHTGSSDSGWGPNVHSAALTPSM